MLPAQAQKKQKKAAVNWVSFEQAEALSKKEPRKILVDIYTDWCGYCRKLESETLRAQPVVAELGKHFVSVKLNGEEIQKDVEVKGPTGGHISNDEKPTGPLLFQGDPP